MHRPVPCNTAKAYKVARPDFDVEMALAPLTVPCVAAMAFAVIDDIQLRGRKRRLKLVCNFLSY